jgi:hypothetical protein
MIKFVKLIVQFGVYKIVIKMSDNKRTLLLALGAGAAVIAAALIYHFASTSTDDSDDIVDVT